MKSLAEYMADPPTTMKEISEVVSKYKHFLKPRSKNNEPPKLGPKGRFINKLLTELDHLHKQALSKAKEIDPIGFFQPSYEQHLVLNAWLYGYSFISIYTANRIGKTAVSIINALMWIFPNNPKWPMFRPYTDHKNRTYKVLPRPDFSVLKLINNQIKFRPIDVPAPDHNQPYDSPTNAKFLQWLQFKIPQLTLPAYPHSPWGRGGTMWFGAQDHPALQLIIWPMIRAWIPASAITRYTLSTKEISLSVPSPSGIATQWEIIGKSYDSKDSKWASGAVDAILLTEGFPESIFTEIKLRFKDPSFGSHDFTPCDAANLGNASRLAYQIACGKEKFPLPNAIFRRWNARDAPTYILSEDKLKGMISSLEGKAEATARLDGDFFTDADLILSNLNRDTHLIKGVTIQEMFNRWPNGRIYRGLDPGYDHPTACAWGYLLPGNIWIIYRIMSERGLTIDRRCARIIRMSNNSIGKQEFGAKPGEFYLQELQNNANSEAVMATFCDYHTFKEDEQTGLPYAAHYMQAGLNIAESTHMAPRDRAVTLNNLLAPNNHFPNIITDTPPGPQVYFLELGPGVLSAIGIWEGLYWGKVRSGENKGEGNDEVPSHGDDELDAVCYITCANIMWTSYQVPVKVGPEIEPEQSAREIVAGQKKLQQLQKMPVQGEDYIELPDDYE